MAAFDWTGSIAPWGEQGTPRLDDDGLIVVGIATCGTCGRSWNDELGTSRTPPPSGRCPFEYDHDDPAEVGEIQAARNALARAEGAATDARGRQPGVIVKALEAGRDAVWENYQAASRGAKALAERAAVIRAEHVNLNTPRARQVREFLAGRYGAGMVTDEMVRSVVAGLDNEG